MEHGPDNGLLAVRRWPNTAPVLVVALIYGVIYNTPTVLSKKVQCTDVPGIPPACGAFECDSNTSCDGDWPAEEDSLPPHCACSYDFYGTWQFWFTMMAAWTGAVTVVTFCVYSCLFIYYIRRAEDSEKEELAGDVALPVEETENTPLLDEQSEESSLDDSSDDEEVLAMYNASHRDSSSTYRGYLQPDSLADDLN